MSALEPGAIATELWRKNSETWEKIILRTKPEIYNLYDKLIQTFKSKTADQKYLEPDTVAEYVYHAFTAKKPKRHYLIGNDAKFWRFIERFPEGMRDWFIYRLIYK